MANMSYCRFHNTLSAFRDCRAVIEEMMDGGDERPLSKDELVAARALAIEAAEFVAYLAEVANKSVESMIERADHVEPEDNPFAAMIDWAQEEAKFAHEVE